MTDVENIAPDGDVILVVGAGKKKLRVTSQTLSSTSPVFKALLGPHFREGQQARSSQDPVAIELPEDPAVGMRMLCRLLECFEFPPRKSAPFSTEILEFVICADKYDCLKAVRWQAKGMLSERLCIIQSNHIIDWDAMLASAYLMQHQEVFKRASAHIIGSHRYRISDLLNYGCENIVPTKHIREKSLQSRFIGTTSTNISLQCSWRKSVPPPRSAMATMSRRTWS